jgi:hypothetical protein
LPDFTHPGTVVDRTWISTFASPESIRLISPHNCHEYKIVPSEIFNIRWLCVRISKKKSSFLIYCLDFGDIIIWMDFEKCLKAAILYDPELLKPEYRNRLCQFCMYRHPLTVKKLLELPEHKVS